MTAADKVGIGLAVGFTIAFVAFALAMAASQNAPAAPIPTPIPTPTPEPIPTPPAPVEEEPEVPEETPEEVPEETPEEVPEETPEETPEESYAADVSISEGSSSQGCETDGTCYVESDLTVEAGTTVTWTNDDTSSHTVTSGTPSGTAGDVFDSDIIESGGTFEYTFDESGEYDYFCVIHPWMAGKVTVE